ncbi:ABC-F family ATP-binding cassette domain-containing protein, partial [Candidatus Peregrinibacteria bacterium]|nr:ABC-F family ATP-binding cassette domain-containing protein [Candidatus Peregrinibacteria bacterium]
VQSRIKSLDKQKIHKKLAKLPEINFHFKSEVFNGSHLLRATNISYAYEEGNPVIEKFSLAVRPQDRIAIIGPNGKGKSTLLRLLVNDLVIQAGNLKSHDNLKIGYFGVSHINSLDPRNTIFAELMALPDSKEQLVRRVCGSLLFTGESVKKQISKLSGGEKSRVGLAKLILSKNNLLVLDEPTNHLDMESCLALTEALEEFPGTVIFVSHDEAMIGKLATRLVVFDGGQVKVIERGYDYFLENIGWVEEEIDVSFKKEGSTNKEIYLEKKEKSKQLRLAQKKLAKLEKSLLKMEAEQEENTLLLSQAYTEKNNADMRNYGAKAKDLHKNIETSYKELERLLEEEAGHPDQ